MPPAAAQPPLASSRPSDTSESPKPTPDVMPYACQTCTKRKVKCDKTTPICSACQKHGLDCHYQAPLPRGKKRRLSNDATQRLAQYEQILLKHDLLPLGAPTPYAQDSPDRVTLQFQQPEIHKTGQVLAGRGRSRYVGSELWHHLGDEVIDELSDEEGDAGDDPLQEALLDPLTGAFLGSHRPVSFHHPEPSHALLLWRKFLENVDPICRMVHKPTLSEKVERLSQHPQLATKSEAALLFAIYHFAIFSMKDAECQQSLGRTRQELIKAYGTATTQALVNASFLKTTEIAVLQALIFYLLACRFSYDAHTYWILTGVTVRIAQRMGLHRDGTETNLPPFEVHMRRLIFYQVIPLDGFAGQSSGTGISIMPGSWTTLAPWNINDDQIWPGMTDEPGQPKGATDMIFALTRATIGGIVATAGRNIMKFKDYHEADKTIDTLESEVEERFLRYCDYINPLHLLALGFARSAIASLKMRARMPKMRSNTMAAAERRELLALAEKILETDLAAHSQPAVEKYLWNASSFFMWGSWDASIYMLDTVRKADLLTAPETDKCWERTASIYAYHEELLNGRRALHVAVGRLVLRAWDVNPPSTHAGTPGGAAAPEPEYIVHLRHIGERRRKTPRLDGEATGVSRGVEASVSPIAQSLLDPALRDENGVSEGSDGVGADMNFDLIDWMFWDDMIKDYNAQGG